MAVSRPSICTTAGKSNNMCGSSSPKDGGGGSGKSLAVDFPIDDTPTPTKILRMADELFPSFGADLKENPFDAHFRKATEAVKSGRI
jgi:hypothetical protein